MKLAYLSSIRAAALAAVLLLGLGVNLPGATLNVPGTHPTIQAAIDAAAPGDTVVIAPGTYTENLSINKSLTLIGSGPASEPTTIINGSGSPIIHLTVSDMSFNFENLIIEGNESSSNLGIRAGSTINIDSLTLKDVIARNCKVAIYLAENYSSGAFQPTTVSNLLFDGVALTNNSHIGAYIGKAVLSGVVMDSTVANNGSTEVDATGWQKVGLQFVAFHGGVPPRVEVSNTTFSNNGSGSSSIERTGLSFYTATNIKSSQDILTVTGCSFFDHPLYAVRIRNGYNIGNTASVDGTFTNNYLDIWFNNIVGSTSSTTNVRTTVAGTRTVGSGPTYDYATIQDAIDAATAGDTIVVAAGTYAEGNININKPLILQGANAGIPAADGSGVEPGGRGAETIMTKSGVSVFNPTSADVTIDGFKFTGGNGRLIDSYANTDNLQILNCVFDLPSGASDGGVIQLDSGSRNGLTIKNNRFAGAATSSWLYLGGTSNANHVLEGNDFVGTGSRAVFGPGSGYANTLIKGNFIGSGIVTGLNLGQLETPVIEENTFVGVQYVAMQIGSFNGGFIRNNSLDGTGSGYYFAPPYDFTLAYGINLFGGAWGTQTCEGLTVEGNTVVNYFEATPGPSDSYAAIYLAADAGPDIQILGNTLEDNTTAIRINSEKSGISVNENILSGNTVALWNQKDASVDATYNYWGSISPDFAQVIDGDNVNVTYWYDDAGLTLIASSLPIRNVTDPGNISYYATIQSAINAGSADDVIEIDSGLYDEGPISVNKAITLVGPNAGLAGDDPARGPEARIANSKLTITAAAVIDGVEIYQTNDTADAVLVQAAATVRNSAIRREGVSTGTIARGITTAVGTVGYAFENNLFTGDPTGGFFSGHTTWNSGMYLNGGSGTITGNTFENCRTAINADDFNAGITISGNSFSTCGTYLAFGGTTPTDGQFTIAGNEFFLDWVDPVTNWLPSTMFNNSNVAATFRLDVTGNTFGGVASANLTDEQKFAIEARNYHRGRSGRNGVVDFVVGEQVVMPGTTILSAIDAADSGDRVLVGPGTYAEAVLVDKAFTLQGAGSGVSILDGSTLTASGLVRIQGLTAGAVTVDGFTLQNAPLSGSNRFAVAISSCAEPAEVTVTNNHIIGRGGPETGVYDWGVVAQNSSATIVINNNTLDDVMNNAILIERATGNVEIGYNTINVPDYDASNAIFSMSYRSGTDLGNVTGLHRYHGNTISSDNPTYGIFGGITVASAYGVWYGERSDGVYSNLVIENNVISDITPWYTSGKGIQLEIDGPDGGFPGVQIRNNIITSLQASTDPAHKSRGIRLLGSVVDPDITGNTLTDLYYGINIRGTFGQALYPSGVEIRNNKLLSNVFGVYNESTLDSDAAENYWGESTGPSHASNPAGTGSPITDHVLYSPWYADEAMTMLVTAANFENTLVAEGATVTEGDLYVGGTYTVEGTLEVTGTLTLAESGVLDVVNGELVINGSTIAGSFTFFNSLGSVNFNDDVSITGSAEGLILISDVHVAAGKTITVDGTLVIDGSTIDSDGRFNLVVAETGDFTMARTVMVNGDMVVNSGAVKVYDNRFETSTINVTALASGAAIYHNITDDLAWLTDSGSVATTSVDGWGNIDLSGSTQNNLLLDVDISSLPADRTKDLDGNVYIQPLDTIFGTIDVSALQAKISGVEMLLGYSTDYLTASTLGEGDNWQLVPPVGYDSATVIGKIDAALGVNFLTTDPDGTQSDQMIADIELTATALEGETVFFQRVKLASESFAGETRLTTGGPSPAYRTPFTANTGTITIDGTVPLIDVASATVKQDAVDMTVSGVITLQGELNITAAAFDALAGIDDVDVVVELVGPAIYPAVLDATSLIDIDGVDYTEYAFVYEVVPATLNGVYDVEMTVTDRSGNQTFVTLGSILINKNLVSVQVELEGHPLGSSVTREVVFVFTGALGSVIETRTVAVEFENGSGTAVFADVDGDSVNLSAKTAWNLRQRLPIGLDGNGQAAVSFLLPGGDLNNDNAVNMLDYSILRFYYQNTTGDITADITADGVVNTTDFGILQANFYLMGDPQ